MKKIMGFGTVASFACPFSSGSADKMTNLFAASGFCKRAH